MSEHFITKTVCDRLRHQGALIYPLIGTMDTPLGWPDRYVAHAKTGGFFIEFKGKYTPIQPRQIERAEMLIARGIMCYVMREVNNTTVSMGYCRGGGVYIVHKLLDVKGVLDAVIDRCVL